MYDSSIKTVFAAIVTVVVIALVMAGCGGGEGAPANVGSVTGYIVDLPSGLGISEMLVTVDGQYQATSTQPNGKFTVTGVAPGVSYDVTVTPTPQFTPIGDPPQATATVIAGQTYAVGTILVIDPAYEPPDIP